MKTIKHYIAILLCISLCAPLAQAAPSSDKRQDAQTTNTIAQDVLIIIQQEQVRFTAQRAVAEMQLQIFDQAGQMAYDSGAVTGPELTWVLRQANGEAVKSGLYAYTLSVKEAGAETARMRRGHFIVDRARERDGQTDRLWITSQNDSGVGTELTVARNEGETIAGTSATTEHRGVRTVEGEARNGASESKNENNGAVAAAAANGTTGRIAKFTSATDLGNSVMTESNGRIGVGKTSPQNLLHVGPGSSSIGAGRVNAVVASNSTDAGIAIAQNSGVNLLLQASGAGAYIGATSNHGLTLRTNDVDRVSVAPNGNVGIGAAPEQKLHVDGNEILSTGIHAGFKFRNRGSVYGGDDWVLYSDNNIARLWRANVGDLLTVDTTGLVGVNALQIRGGADFAENFDVSVAAEGSEAMTKVEAGSVVSIDPTNPGKLQLSTQAYDRRVAGVIGGAGSVKPGMVMSQEGTMADGKHPVALSGRVYCWVDASHGAIEPGDLLTTSSTPGHAMKAADAVKAQGAIIGKAMTGLKEGKGLVLVLVTLQ